MVKPTVKALVDKASAELVEELLESVQRDIAKPWFTIINIKLSRLVKDLRKVK